MERGEPDPSEGTAARPSPADPRTEAVTPARSKAKRAPAKRPAKRQPSSTVAELHDHTDPWQPVTTKVARTNGKNGARGKNGVAAPTAGGVLPPPTPPKPAPPKRRSDELAVTDAADLAGPTDSMSAAATDVVEPAVEGPVEIPVIVVAQPDEAPPTAVEAVVTPTTAAVFTDTDGTDGLPSLTAPTVPARALRAPVVVRRRRRPRVRRVTRVVRHVDTWSVFKVALVFNLFFYGVCLTAGVLLWQVAQNTGTVDNIERFFESNGWQTFQLHGGEIFHNAWIIGLFLAVGGTGMAVLAATLFNLITDLVGGIRVSVLEEEVVAREDRGLFTRRPRLTPMRRRTDFPDVPVPDVGDAAAPAAVAEEPG